MVHTSAARIASTCMPCSPTSAIVIVLPCTYMYLLPSVRSSSSGLVRGHLRGLSVLYSRPRRETPNSICGRPSRQPPIA